MKEDSYQLIGIIGFIFSGLIFLVSAILNRDLLGIAGTLTWIAACIVWMIPMLKRR